MTAAIPKKLIHGFTSPHSSCSPSWLYCRNSVLKCWAGDLKEKGKRRQGSSSGKRAHGWLSGAWRKAVGLCLNGKVLEASDAENGTRPDCKGRVVSRWRDETRKGACSPREEASLSSFECRAHRQTCQHGRQLLKRATSQQGRRQDRHGSSTAGCPSPPLIYTTFCCKSPIGDSCPQPHKSKIPCFSGVLLPLS